MGIVCTKYVSLSRVNGIQLLSPFVQSTQIILMFPACPRFARTCTDSRINILYILSVTLVLNYLYDFFLVGCFSFGGTVG